MQAWEQKLKRDVRAALIGAGRAPTDFVGGNRLHLAVLTEPYLEWVLTGRKSIESRFSVNRVAPYGAVSEGDAMVLKRTSGPIVGLCRLGKVDFYELDCSTRAWLRARFGSRLCAKDDAFWEARARANYATLMHIDEVIRLEPLSCAKRDRRGWVVLAELRNDRLALSGDWDGGAARSGKVERRPVTR